MRRVNWLVTTAALGLGIVVGFLVSTAIMTPASPSAFIKWFGGKHGPVVASAVPTEANANTLTGGSNGASAQSAVPAQTGVSDQIGISDQSGVSGQSGISAQSAVTGQTGVSGQSGATGQPGASEQSGVSGQSPLAAPDPAAGTIPSNPPVSPQTAEKIIADYKQDIGVFFNAWKSPDAQSFRTKLATGYTGDILDKHVSQAEPFLAQGLGVDVTRIDFDRVVVEEADNNTATLQADYRYSARDYSLADAAPTGDDHDQTVHTRVNLVKINSRWLVTGETILN